MKGLVLEALALGIARTAKHWLAVVPVAAAELLSPIRAVSIGESGNSRTKKRYAIHTGALGVSSETEGGIAGSVDVLELSSLSNILTDLSDAHSLAVARVAAWRPPPTMPGILDQNKMNRLVAVRPRLPTTARGLLQKVVLDLERIKRPAVGLVQGALMQVGLLRAQLRVVAEDLRTLLKMLELL